jgi:Flp pilus assembly protein TadD
MLDLDLLFEHSPDGYRVRVLRSPAGDGQSAAFARPFTDLELENLVLKVGKFRTRSRRIEAAPVAAAKQAGGRLFDAMFAGAVGECLHRSADRARYEGTWLRIRLLLSDCPELADLPWELLYDRNEDWFLALSDRTPVVRYVQLPDPPRALSVTLPLRILVIRSEPVDFPELALDAEWSEIAAALAELIEVGSIVCTELAAPTLSELRRALQCDTFHGLHYMGHGGFDQKHGGVLLFTDRSGRAVPVTGGDLGVMLRDHTSMRLAVLNACEGARTDPADPFAGVADTLVRRGIPAVIAMQFGFSDEAAIEFAPALYGALAAGRPVDVAMVEARKAIYAISSLEWATPVLYLRAENAQLFDINEQRAPAPTAASTGPTPNWTIGEIKSQQHRWPEMEAAYREAVRLDPDNVGNHNGHGHMLMRLRRYQEAETAFREAVRLAPGDGNYHASLGVALTCQQKWPEAEAAFWQAVLLDPDEAIYHGDLGGALTCQQKWPEAEAAYREAVRLDPDNASYHGGLGIALDWQRQYREAETALREAIRLDPTDKSFRTYLRHARTRGLF